MPLYFFTESYPYKSGVILTSLSGTDVTPISRAADYDKANYWETDAATPELKIDLGTPQAIDSLWIKSGNVTTFELYHSSDGSSWTLVSGSPVDKSNGIFWFFNFTEQTKRYWKIKVTAKTGNAKIYEFMLMQLRLELDGDNAPANASPIFQDTDGGGYQMADGSYTTFSGENDFAKIDMPFEYTPKANRDNLYLLYSTPTKRPPLVILPDEESPESIFKMLWLSTEFPLIHGSSYKGAGFSGTLSFQEY